MKNVHNRDDLGKCGEKICVDAKKSYVCVFIFPSSTCCIKYTITKLHFTTLHYTTHVLDLHGEKFEVN